MATLAQEFATPSPVVRGAVRDLLSSCQAFESLSPAERKAAANALVKVCQTAVTLMQEEAHADAETGAAQPLRRPRTVAEAQTAGQDFSGIAASKVAGTTQAILNAVSFPRFVTDLINGGFKALIDSNHQQMASYVELIKNVAASLDGFSETNLGPDQARQWLEHFRCLVNAVTPDEVSKFFNFCVDRGWIELSPAKGMKAVKEAAIDKKPFDPSELEKITWAIRRFSCSQSRGFKGKRTGSAGGIRVGAPVDGFGFVM